MPHQLAICCCRCVCSNFGCLAQGEVIYMYEFIWDLGRHLKQCDIVGNSSLT